jgi:hypothetical protein
MLNAIENGSKSEYRNISSQPALSIAFGVSSAVPQCISTLACRQQNAM